MRENADQENSEHGHFSRSVHVPVKTCLRCEFKIRSNIYDKAFIENS